MLFRRANQSARAVESARQSPFMEDLSTLLGYASILVWIFAQSPQLYENYIRKSVTGVSVAFLLLWAVGDILNLIGSYLTHQLPFQQYLAMYFVMIDMTLFLQFVVYRRPKSTSLSPAGRKSLMPTPSSSSDDLVVYPIEDQEISILEGEFYPSNSMQALSADPEEDIQNRPSIPDQTPVTTWQRLYEWHAQYYVWSYAVLALITFWGVKLGMNSISYPDSAAEVGVVISWLCTTCYLSSRIPQIVQNATRGSMVGLSLTMFKLTALGNSLYAASILTRPSPEWAAYLLTELPFLLGSGGALIFDLIIYGQALRFDHASLNDNLVYSTLAASRTRSNSIEESSLDMP